MFAFRAGAMQKPRCAGRRPAWLRPDRGRLRSRRRMVDAREALRLRAGDAGAAARQQRQHLLQLVQSGRHRARRRRGRSIRQMIAQMVAEHGIDPRRIFITGLSAGGGMTSVMLATYPEVFAAGAVIAGLALRHRQQCARSAERHDSFAVAPGARTRRSRAPGLEPSAGHGRRCRCGMAAPTAPSIPAMPTRSSSSGSICTACRAAPMAEDEVDGYPRQVWWNKDGETVVESYTITDMAHGTPLGARRQR